MTKHVIGDAITTNGNYPSDAGTRWYPSALNERGSLFVTGVFDNATAKLQASQDSTTWVDVGANVEFTADGIGNFELFSDAESPIQIRLNVSGGGGSMNIRSNVFNELR